MIHQPPAGARDLLPLEVAQKAWINDNLQRVFQQWGYQRIVTSTLEWLETLTAGGAVDRTKVIQLQTAESQALGLRPELTASIARAAVTRMAENTFPQRLCYRANVFRHPPRGSHGKQMEFYQAGVELLFAAGIVADAEILLLLADSLDALGLEDWQLILGEAALGRSLLDPFPEPVRETVRHCVANLDRVGLQELPLDEDLKAYALDIFDLRGEPETILARVSQFDLGPEAQEIVANLKALFALLAGSTQKQLPIILDLTLIQTFDYYTGIVFEVVNFANHQSYILGQGGRYDQLLGLYHPQRENHPGIGFCLNIEELHTCLLTSPQLPKQLAGSAWLVIATEPNAQQQVFHYAQTLRQGDEMVRVEVELGGRSPAEIYAYARSSHITHLAWIDPSGEPKLETL
ncbi:MULTISPECIES: ATP phosphoribosyltransferase regulatory subunit [Cyanophyceae]|uniref:ATP phosphoribosyltransferase regulatory subunit n=1 Tax=Picosynechococcus sp. (strain ATCC 27264 / PCC 7002 / PR-6) TaxID=32049 RepID=HISZ_PICP2|nr:MULTISPECIES: ATP phosphoribosyltransferase regulatory subunit [Cyanophyceae]B1XPZ9.1 RecName: Full=ATP phosphoribosyltransferase regulatory subunit [Picosynechococcus sp. PCC 7002]ACA98627.1 ATP phosphoribosyltransferase regulatory subunit [Picosynechococcus sp. PCC 7002]SMH40453.1 ATP phosphoribosyltransferase regulatory subunit [Picosynechococcus sp. OG1]SMQ78387.1 ATP phosphoribosyltransferase regulatory subunit [Synechococcus sp. 7002]